MRFVRSTVLKATKILEINADFNLLSLHVKKVSSHLISIYNPGQGSYSTFQPQLEGIIADLSTRETICAGDFNIDWLNGSNQEVISHSNLMSANGFSLTNSEYPTRVCPSKRSLLDHIFVNFPSNGRIDTIMHDFSDHNILSLNLTLDMSNCQKPHSDTFSRVKISKLLRMLESDQTLAGISNNCDPETFAHLLIDVLQTNINKATITKECKQSGLTTGSAWITSEYLELCKIKQELYCAYTANPHNSKLKRDYTKCRNRVLGLKRKLKYEYGRDKLDTIIRDPKRFWNIVNELLTNKSTNNHNVPEKVLYNNVTLTDPKEIVRCFNDFFC